MNALKVLSSYPDYGKATEGYINGVVEAFAQFDEGIQIQLAHISLGLRARHSYLPTVQNVIDLARELLAERSRKADFEKRFSGRVVETKFIASRPLPALNFFPVLTRMLGAQAETLLRGLQFDHVQEAAKLQHTKGNEAARNYLQAFQTKAKAA